MLTPDKSARGGSLPRRLRALGIVIVIAACCALEAGSVRHALAQDDARTQAASHFKRGLSHAQQHAYAEALTEFEAAYQLVSHASVLYNIALAHVGLGRFDAAMATLRRYLAEPKESVAATQRKAAQVLLDDLTAKSKKATASSTASAPLATAQVQLTVVVFPYGKVWIDGQLVGDSPLTATVTAGPHRVAGGRATADQAVDVTLEAGAARRVVLAWARQDLVQVEPAAVGVKSPDRSPSPKGAWR